MKGKTIVALSILSSALAGCAPQSEAGRGFPSADLSNGAIKARVAIDTANRQNYYRATRFDWSGIVYSLEYKGHSYFGEWVDKVDPNINDSICGPVEEFAQIGYEAAPVGGEFLKIGVGALKKTDSEPYAFAKSYPIVNTGKWECSHNANSVSYKQTLESKIASYEYCKKIELVPNSPAMKISHSLKNTGKTPIETTVYNHNFFMLDNERAGKAISIKFAYEPKDPAAVLHKAEKYTSLKGNTLTYTQDFGPSDLALYRWLNGHDKVENYDFRLENSKTGAAVRIRSDKPLMKFTFWSCYKTYCVEPFTKISVAPGDTFEWSITYDFYIK